ncbi:ABC transporter permease [Synoicihabitans lomoniglobus]|uniref:ABC transporter permease n=1 Tax=Synoicihabitans lomoniglobus TaxID=2909285 RepID=A0AAF0CS05_9BACT|nr:ABC transporter permease [Opitutaceae bacterium LMO-M01]WED66952.1 ABC transporter permease [Opitutaceae bacterium LMO-M01]
MSLLKFAFRKLLHQPLYTALAIGTLGIGIGSVVTCFSAVNTMMFRPLPAASHGDAIVTLSQFKKSADGEGKGYRMGMNALDGFAVAARSESLDGVWLHTDLTVILAGDAGPMRFLGTRLSPLAFAEMGVQPQLGRKFTAADALPDAEPVALISDDAWTKRFERDPLALDSVIKINGIDTRIIGVMPVRWRYPEFSDVWLPLGLVDSASLPREMLRRGAFYFAAHGRLRTGVTVEAAQAELDRIADELAREHPDTNTGIGISVMSWRQDIQRDSIYFILMLFIAGTCIFLISCANIANLQLARGSDRGPEIAVRIALGASRWQVFRQLAVENLVLGLLGAAMGAVVGLWGIDLVVTSLNIEPPFWLQLDPDWRVLSFTVVCGFLASFIFGLAPALRDSRPDLSAGLKESSRTGLDQGPFGQRLRNAIVIMELALALVLLVGAGLMTRSFLKLRAIEPGYDSSQVLTFRAGFPQGYSETPEEEADFFSTLPRQLEKLDGITHAAAITQLPGSHNGAAEAILLEENAGLYVPRITLPRVAYRGVSRGYFDTLRIPVIAGRDFEAADRDSNQRVAIVDTAFAEDVGMSPEALLGQRIDATENWKGTDMGDTAIIVGVVGAIRHVHSDDGRRPTLYFSILQSPVNFMSVAVRTTGDPSALAATIGNEVLGVHSGMPIYTVLTLDQVILRTIWQQYFFSRLLLFAGIIAVGLACVGIYGVMTFAVSMRQHEIGLRMALGAPASEVVGDVVRKGLHLVVLGLGAGFIAATLLANLLSGTLYGITPHDPPTFAIVPTLLAAVALLSCYLSSRRATRINPMAAMRME